MHASTTGSREKGFPSVRASHQWVARSAPQQRKSLYFCYCGCEPRNWCGTNHGLPLKCTLSSVRDFTASTTGTGEFSNVCLAYYFYLFTKYLTTSCRVSRSQIRHCRIKLDSFRFRVQFFFLCRVNVTSVSWLVDVQCRCPILLIDDAR